MIGNKKMILLALALCGCNALVGMDDSHKNLVRLQKDVADEIMALGEELQLRKDQALLHKDRICVPVTQQDHLDALWDANLFMFKHLGLFKRYDNTQDLRFEGYWNEQWLHDDVFQVIPIISSAKESDTSAQAEWRVIKKIPRLKHDSSDHLEYALFLYFLPTETLEKFAE